MRKSLEISVLTISTVLILSGCSSTSSTAETSGPPTDAIAQMEIAFEDSPRQAVIREAMDKAFSAVEMTPTADDLSRAGSVLVSFRKKYGISEMEILECMPHRAADPRAPEVNFGTIAAVCVTDLSSGVSVP